MEQEIDMLIDTYQDLDELFEVLDIELYRVIEILVKGGHVKIPDHIKDSVWKI